MNSPRRRHVCAPRLVIAVVHSLCLALTACQDVDGGAVELSWSLAQRSDGESVGCAEARVERMRLFWQAGTMQDSASWACDDYSGVTGFDLPAGTVSLWVRPECGGDVMACVETFDAPAPLERAVAAGEVITLNAVQVMVEYVPNDVGVGICPIPARPCP